MRRILSHSAMGQRAKKLKLKIDDFNCSLKILCSTVYMFTCMLQIPYSGKLWRALNLAI